MLAYSSSEVINDVILRDGEECEEVIVSEAAECPNNGMRIINLFILLVDAYNPW